jgi:hypothetical protein
MGFGPRLSQILSLTAAPEFVCFGQVVLSEWALSNNGLRRSSTPSLSKGFGG